MEVKMDHSRMPVLFIGHGSPMNAIEDNEFSRAWQQAAVQIPKPKAILCISAHWETQGSQVTMMEQPRTIHDFYGFPRELFEMQYPAAGSPELARKVIDIVDSSKVQPDYSWGLDHGAWSVMCRMYPQADIPVIQLSLDRQLSPTEHYEIGQKLNPLRQEGVLILGSGNIVHNLRLMMWQDTAFDWAIEYDRKVRQWIVDGAHEEIIHYEKHGKPALLAVNSAEHYLPLLYILGLQQPQELASFFAETLWGGSLSMRCVRLG